MQAFIDELDGVYRSNRFVVNDTVLSLTAKAARDMITLDMLTQRLVTTDKKEDWQSWDAERLIEALKRLYPDEAVSRFQPAATRWAEVAARVSSVEALRLNDPLGPTNNARGKFLTVLVQALAELGESCFETRPNRHPYQGYG